MLSFIPFKLRGIIKGQEFFFWVAKLQVVKFSLAAYVVRGLNVK